MFKDDNILQEFVKITNGDKQIDAYENIVKFVENSFKIAIDKNISLDGATIGGLIEMFGEGFYDQYLRHDNSYILKKHQKISAMKDQMVKDETLKMVCE
jgi:hypothetical protein